ncbi:hypothetical protein HPB51_022145 [Rhipicephalus microplus]|uniref:Uncharacterized protein n=1 Tax=Rhipicephalus microplus TaxID=6941 RepID=A0A9J6EBQ0_RHIMP|nr:hypothetical protein HPB51_022145 [Rhipicephalus microplus]
MNTYQPTHLSAVLNTTTAPGTSVRGSPFCPPGSTCTAVLHGSTETTPIWGLHRSVFRCRVVKPRQRARLRSSSDRRGGRPRSSICQGGGRDSGPRRRANKRPFASQTERLPLKNDRLPIPGINGRVSAPSLSSPNRPKRRQSITRPLPAEEPPLTLLSPLRVPPCGGLRSRLLRCKMRRARIDDGTGQRGQQENKNESCATDPSKSCRMAKKAGGGRVVFDDVVVPTFPACSRQCVVWPRDGLERMKWHVSDIVLNHNSMRDTIQGPGALHYGVSHNHMVVLGR